MNVPEKVRGLVYKEQLAYSNQTHLGIDLNKLTDDQVSLIKPQNEIGIISRYLKNETIAGKKLLNIGSGFGIFNLVAIQQYGIDAYGIEPNGVGFGNSLEISKILFKDNNLPIDRLIAAFGEEIPFEDNTFDIVYSTNVLEHVQDPLKVLEEGLRVLKPGGTLQYVYPNFGSFFDGHYAVILPPIPFKSFYPWFIKYIVGRDNVFAKTINAELNVPWAINAVKLLSYKYKIELVSLGEDIFKERMTSMEFGNWAGLYKIKRIVNILNRLKLKSFVVKFLLLFKAWSPVILTIRKLV
jgi:ubiquinone/menaquinone biosynthesis C-methylase UbiE